AIGRGASRPSTWRGSAGLWKGAPCRTSVTSAVAARWASQRPGSRGRRKLLTIPVADRRLPQGHGGDGGGIGPQDARPQRDGGGEGQGPQPLALLGREPALRPDQYGPLAVASGGQSRHRGRAAGLVAEHQPTPVFPAVQQGVQL